MVPSWFIPKRIVYSRFPMSSELWHDSDTTMYQGDPTPLLAIISLWGLWAFTCLSSLRCVFWHARQVIGRSCIDSKISQQDELPLMLLEHVRGWSCTSSLIPTLKANNNVQAVPYVCNKIKNHVYFEVLSPPVNIRSIQLANVVEMIYHTCELGIAIMDPLTRSNEKRI